MHQPTCNPGWRSMRAAAGVFAWAAIAVAGGAAVAAPPPGEAFVRETRVEVEVQAGDSLARLGARYGLASALLARDNGLPADARLVPGQTLRVDVTHILPRALAGDLKQGIVINVPQRMLYRIEDDRLSAAYPVALGRPDWPTPLGTFTVTSRQTDKAWIVPPSIQEEMRREGKPVVQCVPPGPGNPLGRHWIGTSLPGIGIHGTIAPASVYGFASHGCVRMHPDDVAALHAGVRVGEPGRIVYQAVLLAADGLGNLWFEAHPDVYRRDRSTLDGLREQAATAGWESRIDWPLLAAALRAREGRALRVGTVERPALPK